MRLLLIRHGQTPANVRGELSTAYPGPGLTRLGARQAAEVPEALRGEQIDAIFTSTLVRTRETAEPLAIDRGLEIQVRNGLHEIEAGELEDRTDMASVRIYLKTAFAWGMGDLDPRMPGAENGHEFFARFDRDIEHVAEKVEGTAVVVSHGAAIRVWVAGRASNVPRTFAGKHELDNTGIVELEGSPGDWTLTTWAGTPVGGSELADVTAEDHTGETLDEAGVDTR